MKISNVFKTIKKKSKGELYYSFLPIVLCFCWLISFLPNLTSKLSFQPFIFLGSSTVSSILRLLGGLIIGVYFFIYLFHNKESHKRSFVVASLLVFFIVISFYNFKTSVTYNALDTSYKVISTEHISIGIFDIFLHYGNTILRFVFLLILFVLFPSFPNKEKSISILCIFVGSIMAVSLLYSFIFEYGKYISTLKNYANGKYDLDISSFFPSKNSFGLFLFQNVFALLCLLFFKRNKINKLGKIVLIALTIITIFVIICSKCFTSILSVFFFLLSYSFIYVFRYKKHKILSLFYLSLIVSLIVLFILFLTIPQMHSGGVFSKLYESISSIFDDTRLYIYSSYFNNLRLGDLLCGYGFRSRYFITFWTTNSGGYISVYDMHNGILQFSVLYGLFFVVLYLSLCVLSIMFITKNNSLSLHKKFLIISIILSTLFYGMLEDVQLFLTSSANSFLISFIVASCFKGSTYEN